MKKAFLILLGILPLLTYAQLSVEFEQLHTGCSSGCTGTVKVTASGGVPPYTYDWKSADVDQADETIAINLCGGNYDFTLRDSNGDVLHTQFFVDLLLAPEVNIYVIQGDTLYIQDPTAEFYFVNQEEATNPILDWVWDFGDGNTASGILTPTHTYTNSQEYLPNLTITYAENCDTTYIHPIEVLTVNLKIPNIITPNGDGINDTFIITENLGDDTGSSNFKSNTEGFSMINDFYISNELIIFNRWGQKVYTQKNYQNDWDGEKLSDGVYYYVLKCHGKFKDDTFKGSITILGSSH